MSAATSTQPWATVTPTWNGVELRFGCSDEEDFACMLADLKQCIGPSGRRWRPETKTWWIASWATSELHHWRRRWDTADGPPAAGRRRHTRRAEADEDDETLYDQIDPRRQDYARLHLLPSAPPELIRAAYRCLALLNHPDRGGDTVVMQAINLAYERLQEPA